MTGRVLLTVVRPGLPLPAPSAGETVVGFDEFARWIKSGTAVMYWRRFERSRMIVHRLESVGRPLPLGLALRWMTRREVRIEDVRGRRRLLEVATLARWLAQAAAEPFKVDPLLHQVGRQAGELEHAYGNGRLAEMRLDLSKPPVYLRSDLSFGVRAGGSVGHIAGVVNEFGTVAASPILVTTDEIAAVNPSIEQHVVEPPGAFWHFKELPTFVLNATLEAATVHALATRTPAFVYQRYSLNNFTGLRIARRYGVPLVIEYNGSEIWMSRHWGRPLKYERLSNRIEQLNLRAADLVVVVSRAMKDEVVARGIAAERVLVNPNGVDVDRYSPEIDGTPVRAALGLQTKTVLGFIGTFGPWHGAETLAHAYVRFRHSEPALAAGVRLLMIGTGPTINSVKTTLADGGSMDATVFTGLVPQQEGAQYLAACDILVSPHVPNPDGSPFFGSPTKLFEYMAMGKAIVASNLEQIGEVLGDQKTAILVPPGDVDALAAAIARLVSDAALRRCLGAEARREAVARHTWRQHTQRIVDTLRAVMRSSR
jgi:glycosyltransferase involved in cell wall biosynthesis